MPSRRIRAPWAETEGIAQPRSASIQRGRCPAHGPPLVGPSRGIRGIDVPVQLARQPTGYRSRERAPEYFWSPVRRSGQLVNLTAPRWPSVVEDLSDRGDLVFERPGPWSRAGDGRQVGACLRAPFFRQLTDRLRSKKIFRLTLGLGRLQAIGTASLETVRPATRASWKPPSPPGNWGFHAVSSLAVPVHRSGDAAPTGRLRDAESPVPAARTQRAAGPPHRGLRRPAGT